METGPKFMVVSERAPSFAEAARNLSLSLPRLPLWSMADTIVIGEELARLNTNFFTDIATRNPRIRYNVLLFYPRNHPSEKFQVEVSEDIRGVA
jgi:hypothetical protein